MARLCQVQAGQWLATGMTPVVRMYPVVQIEVCSPPSKPHGRKYSRGIHNLFLLLLVEIQCRAVFPTLDVEGCWRNRGVTSDGIAPTYDDCIVLGILEMAHEVIRE